MHLVSLFAADFTNSCNCGISDFPNLCNYYLSFAAIKTVCILSILFSICPNNCNFLPWQYGRENEDTEAVCNKLKKDLQTVFNILPKDTQQLLVMNPERAFLLQEIHKYSGLPEHAQISDGVLSSSPHRWHAIQSPKFHNISSSTSECSLQAARWK